MLQNVFFVLVTFIKMNMTEVDNEISHLRVKSHESEDVWIKKIPVD